MRTKAQNGWKKNHSGSALGWSTDSVRTEPWLPVENGHTEGCGIFRNEILICLIFVLTRADDDTCRHSGVKWECRSHGNAIRRPLSNRRPHSSRRFQLASQVQSPPALSPSSDFNWYFSIINFFFQQSSIFHVQFEAFVNQFDCWAETAPREKGGNVAESFISFLDFFLPLLSRIGAAFSR